MTTPVTYKLAQILKEKAFDENCYRTYNHLGKISPFPLLENMGGEPILNPLDYKWKNSLIHSSVITAPTIAEVVMWLYENHGIWISVNQIQQQDTFTWELVQSNLEKWHSTDWSGDDFNSPTEAYEAAIEYCLTNLI